MPFDPDAAAKPGSGLFGLPSTRDQSRVIVLPVPFDATTSYGKGTAEGPAAVLEASAQVDLYDHRFGRVYEQGIFMEPISEEIAALSREAGALAQPLIDKGGAEPGDEGILARINAACERVNAFTEEHTRRVLREGKIPALLGGEHSTPFGAIKACAEHTKAAGHEMGLLHVDAHMDLRDAFEGFAWSHASIMHNVVSRVPGLRLVQFGIRDFSEGELTFSHERGVKVWFDADLADRQARGERFADLAREAIDALPRHVYVSFDIDGLDPALCPHTGTPVPGGLSFQQAILLLKLLKDSGRRVVGFDLVEVAPGPEGDWDANVGARVLYALCGLVAPG